MPSISQRRLEHDCGNLPAVGFEQSPKRRPSRRLEMNGQGVARASGTLDVCAKPRGSAHQVLPPVIAAVQNNCPARKCTASLTAAVQTSEPFLPKMTISAPGKRAHSASASWTSRMLGNVVIAVSPATRQRPPLHEHRHSRGGRIPTRRHSPRIHDLRRHGSAPLCGNNKQGIATACSRPVNTLRGQPKPRVMLVGATH